MLRTTGCAIVLATALSAVAQTGIVSWHDVEAGEATKNSCAVVTSEKELESGLKQAGWNPKSPFPHIFPPWKDRRTTATIAAVVTASDRFAQPLPVAPAPDELLAGTTRLTIRLQRDVSSPNSGVLVIVLNPTYKSVKHCAAEYAADDDVIASAAPLPPNSGSNSGSSVSTNSAHADVLASTGVTPKVAQQHVVEQTRVDPEYPSDADRQEVKGPVTLHVEIDKDGNVTDAWLDDEELASHNPALARAAIAAVKRWKYEPFKNDRGQAIRVHADVQVNFRSDEDEDDQ
jgi:TonB family protein